MKKFGALRRYLCIPPFTKGYFLSTQREFVRAEKRLCLRTKKLNKRTILTQYQWEEKELKRKNNTLNLQPHKKAK